MAAVVVSLLILIFMCFFMAITHQKFSFARLLGLIATAFLIGFTVNSVAQARPATIKVETLQIYLKSYSHNQYQFENSLPKKSLLRKSVTTGMRWKFAIRWGWANTTTCRHIKTRINGKWQGPIVTKSAEVYIHNCSVAVKDPDNPNGYNVYYYKTKTAEDGSVTRTVLQGGIA